jgi:hypothetical protein
MKIVLMNGQSERKEESQGQMLETAELFPSPFAPPLDLRHDQHGVQATEAARV